MAKNQQNQGDQVRVLEYVDAETLDADRSDEEKAFEEFITGLGAEKMGVLRVGKLKLGPHGTPLAQNKSAHCFACPIDQYTFDELLDFLREHYGSGLYRITGIPAGERVKFNKIVEIAEDLKPGKKAAGSAAESPLGILESASRIMADSAARTEALIERMAVTRAPAVDPTEQFMKMAGLFQGMMAAMAPMFKPVAPGGDFLGELQKFAQIKTVLGGLTGGGDSGGSGAESNFYDVVKAGLQSFGPLLTTMAARAAVTPGVPSLPNPALAGRAPVTPPVQSQPAAGGADPAMASFKQKVDTLVTNAKNGMDPMQLAGTIVDLTPDDKLDALASMLEAPNIIEQMAALNPEVRNYREFFDKLRTGILSLLAEDETATVPATGPVAGGETNGAPAS